MGTRKPIYSLIHEDHSQIETLFDALRDTGPREADVRRRLLAQLSERLLDHGEVEETLHSVFQRPYGTADAVRRARAQFREVHSILGELCAMSPDDTDWWRKLDVLRRQVHPGRLVVQKVVARQVDATCNRLPVPLTARTAI